MTAHPIDTEALRDRLRRNAQAPMDRVERLNGMGGSPEYGDDERPFPDEMLELLDLLATAEHRATRAEAQSEARRINTEYWKEKAVARGISFREARAERDQNLEDLGEAEARIKAVRELHQQSELIRRIPRFMRQGHDDDQPFHYCTGCDGARYPCGTIRALDATTTTQETR